MLCKFFNGLAGLALCCAGVSAYALEVRVLDSQGVGVHNAVVALNGAKHESAPPGTYAIIDQIEREFVPQVVAIQAGTQIRFPNSDDIRHHVYSFSSARHFELKLYHGSTAEPVQFDVAGKVVLGCNIHDSMIGYIYVLDTPYYALTNADGLASISAPLGDYQLEVQHPLSAASVVQPLAIDNTELTASVTLPPLTPDPRVSQPKTTLQQLFDR